MICQKCGVEAPTKRVSFHQNIGAVVVLFTKSVDGRLCKSCVHQTFWRMTSTTAVLGWWGVISFFLTPLIIVNNLGWYLVRLGMPPVPPGAEPPRLDERVAERIKPHFERIVNRLEAGDDIAAVCEEAADLAGVTPGQVALFLQQLFHPAE